MRRYCRPNHGRTATSKADINSLASRSGNTGVDFGRAQGLGLIAPPPGPDQGHLERLALNWWIGLVEIDRVEAGYRALVRRDRRQARKRE
jgi:hypothetical protein